MEIFRERLREAVNELCRNERISQGELADELEIERTTFRNYWTRAHGIPMDKLRRICDRLCIDANYLIGRDVSSEFPKNDPLEEINRKLDKALK